MENKKTIKIFVSSTFCDMHRERDLLHPIEALINRDIESRGYQIRLVDLRYGIDTSGEVDEIVAERKVLEGCFKAIDECQLFFLILGERYGTVIKDTNRDAIPIKQEDIHEKSVTHLEWIYGQKKISSRNTLVFMREFEEEISVPNYYRDEGQKKDKLDYFKKEINRVGAKIDSYTARIENGQCKIMESYFYKHALVFLKQMVVNYIGELEGGIEERHTKSFFERRSDALVMSVKKKAERHASKLYSVYEKLVWLRIEELLNKEDYEEINRRGGTGTDQIEYRKQLVDNCPDDIQDIIEDTCGRISAMLYNIDSTEIFKYLCIVAFIQKEAFKGLEIVSSKEIEIIKEKTHLCKEEYEKVSFTYDDFKWNRYNDSIEYSKPTKVDEAFTYFVHADILKFDGVGYSIVDNELLDFLYAQCDMDLAYSVEIYYSQVWWFLPEKKNNFLALLQSGKCELVHNCLKYVWCSETIIYEIKGALCLIVDKKDYWESIRKYVFWCIETEQSELEVLYLLFNLLQLDINNKYRKEWKLLCKDVLDNYLKDECKNLTRKYVLFYLNRALTEANISYKERIFTWDEKYEIEHLETILWHMFSVVNKDEREYHNELLRELHNHYINWDSICDILQFGQLIYKNSGHNVLINFTPEFLSGKISENQYKYLAKKILRATISYEEEWSKGTVIKDISEDVLKPLYINGKYDVCFYIFTIIYDAIRFEEFVRCCEWIRWVYYMDMSLVRNLYSKTQQQLVAEVFDLIEEYYFVDLDDLIEIDKEIYENKEDVED